MLLAVALQGVWFFFIFAMNRNSGTHPNKFLGIILPQNSFQNVCDSKGLKDRESVGSATTDKRCGHFRDFAADRDFGLGSNYSKTVELCSPKLNTYKS